MAIHIVSCFLEFFLVLSNSIVANLSNLLASPFPLLLQIVEDSLMLSSCGCEVSISAHVMSFPPQLFKFSVFLGSEFSTFLDIPSTGFKHIFVSCFFSSPSANIKIISSSTLYLDSSRFIIKSSSAFFFHSSPASLELLSSKIRPDQTSFLVEFLSMKILSFVL